MVHWNTWIDYEYDLHTTFMQIYSRLALLKYWFFIMGKETLVPWPAKDGSCHWRIKDCDG